ncbi:MAG TPA: pilus assembly protein PilF, partial [Gammaproteobacteria bacterium]|nr:pilus assembly protein PilF [Gammaproteobacteria bacterium]
MRLTNKYIQRILFWVAVTVILIATASAYYPGLHGPFMFDDIPNIVGNQALHITSLSPSELLRAAFSSRSGILYRPISMLSFAFNLYFFGDNSFSFKLTNIIIHLINALLILWLTRRLLFNC